MMDRDFLSYFKPHGPILKHQADHFGPYIFCTSHVHVQHWQRVAVVVVEGRWLWRCGCLVVVGAVAVAGTVTQA